MKKNVKIILVFIILISLTTVCFAGGYAINPDAFGATYDTDISKAKTLGETILGYIVNIAAVSSVVIIAFLGIKFMLGSVEQRAEYKKSFMPLIVGMLVVLGASMIVGIFYDGFYTEVQVEKCEHIYETDRNNELIRRCIKCGVEDNHIKFVCVGGYCDVCGETLPTTEHRYRPDGVCMECGYRK